MSSRQIIWDGGGICLWGMPSSLYLPTQGWSKGVACRGGCPCYNLKKKNSTIKLKKNTIYHQIAPPLLHMYRPPPLCKNPGSFPVPTLTANPLPEKNYRIIWHQREVAHQAYIVWHNRSILHQQNGDYFTF